jgi:hypothetical protein
MHHQSVGIGRGVGDGGAESRVAIPADTNIGGRRPQSTLGMAKVHKTEPPAT